MDNQVWKVALECGLNIPGSHYFLADAGYADDPRLLLPYCGIQYHLAKWNWASQKYVIVQPVELNTDHFYRPWNKEELFNLQHASAWNIIKCIFGVLKCKFHILWMAPEYNMSLQAWIPVALATVHNFIQEHEPEEEENDDDPNDLQPIGGGWW